MKATKNDPIVSTTTSMEIITKTFQPNINLDLNHCFSIGYWCNQLIYQNQIRIENVKDPYVCQKKCQDTTSPLGCKMFHWNSMDFSCSLSQDCQLITMEYIIAGPKECPETN